MGSLKLNIGAGDVQIDGWTPIDRKHGSEAYPLDYPDNSVDEIRASHILEHFSFRDASEALRDWVRVLKPGGRIRISVPDVDKVLTDGGRDRLFVLMGGQTDADNFHRSAYDHDRLHAVMAQSGLVNINPWTSDNTDSAALPISLNLEGVKPDGQQSQDINIGAFMTLPRYDCVIARGVIDRALKALNIPLATSQGVYYGQCMQRMFEDAIKQGVDWILTIDGDSLFTAEQLSGLLDRFAQTPEADAMAALQCRRGAPFPLLTRGSEQELATDGAPILVTTAHFGLTLIRTDALREVGKPWFYSQPDNHGEWGDERLDDDIWFWHQWRLAEKTIYVDPLTSIGHLEEMVAVFDDDLKPQHMYVRDWRCRNLGE